MAVASRGILQWLLNLLLFFKLYIYIYFPVSDWLVLNQQRLYGSICLPEVTFMLYQHLTLGLSCLAGNSFTEYCTDFYFVTVSGLQKLAKETVSKKVHWQGSMYSVQLPLRIELTRVFCVQKHVQDSLWVHSDAPV